MLVFDKYRPVVEIKLTEPGVYVFANSSADGKTYLCSLLQSMSDYERVNAITLYDLNRLESEVFFDSRRYDLLLLDRYDMYAGKFLEQIEKFAKAGIVLVDSKSYQLPMSVSSCMVKLQRSKVTVL